MSSRGVKYLVKLTNLFKEEFELGKATMMIPQQASPNPKKPNLTVLLIRRTGRHRTQCNALPNFLESQMEH